MLLEAHKLLGENHGIRGKPLIPTCIREQYGSYGRAEPKSPGINLSRCGFLAGMTEISSLWIASAIQGSPYRDLDPQRETGTCVCAVLPSAGRTGRAPRQSGMRQKTVGGNGTENRSLLVCLVPQRRDKTDQLVLLFVRAIARVLPITDVTCGMGGFGPQVLTAV